jgi:alpha-D-ribose 1-methylphosphonate 5-triphosphate diphosphatase
MRIQGGQTLVDGQLIEADVRLDEAAGVIDAVGAEGGNGRAIDARGLHVLPGIVDIHGDAFERQLMPRPGVGFPIDVALLDSDRQAVANGITTIFHGVTWSWEPGLRGADNARGMVTAIEALRPALGADTHCHLRFETFNLDADEVPGSIARLAAAANAGNVATLSHDDMSPEQRRWFRDLDCRLAEFPTTLETAADATAAGDDVVMGAPNVVRGGSHIGWIGAADMIARGFCTILASDYYYPALLLAAFRLAADEVVPLPAAWAYVAENPARAAGLRDRGVIAAGRRADVVMIDASDALRPKTVATISNGRIVHLTDPGRLH